MSEATSNLIFSLLNASVLVKIRIFSVFCKEFSSLQSLLEDRRCLVFTMCYPVKLSIYAIFAINLKNYDELIRVLKVHYYLSQLKGLLCSLVKLTRSVIALIIILLYFINHKRV